MTSGLIIRRLGTQLQGLAMAAALACGATSSMAADDAQLTITSFTVSAQPFSGTFAWAVDAYQSFALTALDGGGLYGSSTDNFNSADWNLGLNRHAQTTNAVADGNTVQYTDPSTQLTTGGFHLASHADAGSFAGTVPANSANASALQSGSFVLLDQNGAVTGGTITFDIYYDMSVSTLGGWAQRYTQTTVNLLSSSDGGATASFADGLVSSPLASGAGATSGHFTWTYTLAAGDAAYYTLSGSAIAVAAVPEPGTYLLLACGLVGLAGTVLRRRNTA